MEDEWLPQDHDDQAADETQTQTAKEAEPMTVHFEVNCKFQPFSSSHGYQSHWLNTLNVPWSAWQIRIFKF